MKHPLASAGLVLALSLLPAAATQAANKAIYVETVSPSKPWSVSDAIQGVRTREGSSWISKLQGPDDPTQTLALGSMTLTNTLPVQVMFSLHENQDSTSRLPCSTRVQTGRITVTRAVYAMQPGTTLHLSFPVPLIIPKGSCFFFQMSSSINPDLGFIAYSANGFTE